MAIETDTVTLPDYWACYLINGDASGMSDEEIVECDEYVNATICVDGWYIVDMVEDSERFTWNYRLYCNSDCSGGSVADYIVHRSVV